MVLLRDSETVGGRSLDYGDGIRDGIHAIKEKLVGEDRLFVHPLRADTTRFICRLGKLTSASRRRNSQRLRGSAC
jgi:hypothetical protein